MSEEPGYIRIAGVVRESIVDGPGIRFTIFCQGCPHGCQDCHNEATHDFKGGYDCSIEKIMEEISKNPLLQGVTFSGGEPMCQPEVFLRLAEKIKQKGTLDLTIFTGYTYEELLELNKETPEIGQLLEKADYLVDGRFEAKEKDLTLRFRGSRNQRFIDLNASRAAGTIVLLEN